MDWGNGDFFFRSYSAVLYIARAPATPDSLSFLLPPLEPLFPHLIASSCAPITLPPYTPYLLISGVTSLRYSVIMSKTFSKDDVASHSKGDSLWIIVDEDVYDVTKFQDEHPGKFSLGQVARQCCATSARSGWHVSRSHLLTGFTNRRKEEYVNISPRTGRNMADRY